MQGGKFTSVICRSLGGKDLHLRMTNLSGAIADVVVGRDDTKVMKDSVSTKAKSYRFATSAFIFHQSGR